MTLPTFPDPPNRPAQIRRLARRGWTASRIAAALDLATVTVLYHARRHDIHIMPARRGRPHTFNKENLK